MLPSNRKTNIGGNKIRSIPIINSTKRTTNTIRLDTEIRTDFMAMPKNIEKMTRPSRYSFFNGLKKVRKRSGKDRSAATYRLRSTKKLSIPPSTSLYQNAIR